MPPGHGPNADAPEHSRGYGFVVFERARDAAAAQRALNGSVLAGREVKVSLSQSYNAKLKLEGRADRDRPVQIPVRAEAPCPCGVS